ncbi:hypothetical protein [Donghicola tyrosinivorans]|uniref:YCII-related domain-containing protein n=1 Tax=Donghicola tyrosinivorans TaxID=1652492 RepID=A0A2T0WXL8_9RHOB|nr:hypothetical protein [Donghicola tyrosinivorans]PRY91442.1 hypothetical protein CLV74_10325 [Donghicola tyrosinivorans]
MPKFLFVYHGGEQPGSPDEAVNTIKAWNRWVAHHPGVWIDEGFPVGQSHTVSVSGTVPNGGANPTMGISVIEVPTLQEALDIASGCPMIAMGGSVEVAEAHEIPEISGRE